MRRRTLVLAVPCALALVSHLRADETGLAEIVVTANKITEPLNKVAGSIGVLTGAALDAQKSVDLQDIVNSVPGISSDFAGAPGTSTITIRGISPGGGSLPTTGEYLDEVSINMGLGGFHGAYEPAFFDLDRIEIFRGPQGALYGADSFGGTLLFITKQPQLDQVSGNTTIRIYDQKSGDPSAAVQGAITLPLVAHEVAIRLAALYQYDGGFIDHLAPDGSVARRNTNAQNISAFRTTLLWQPSDMIKIAPMYQYQLTRNGDTWFYDPSLGAHDTPRALNEPLHDRFELASLPVTVSWDSTTLTSVTSYVDRALDRTQDFSIYDMSSYIAPVVAPFYDPTNAKGSLQALDSILVPGYHHDGNMQWHEEIRLASHFDAVGLNTLLGLYFGHEQLDFYSHEYAGGFGAETERLFGVTANEALTQAFGLASGEADLEDSLTLYDNKEYIQRKALYLQGAWTPPVAMLNRVTLTAGVRVSQIKLKEYGYNDGLFDGGFSLVDKSFHETQVAPQYKVAYQATQSALLYVSAGKGFRLGGVNSPLPSSCDAEIKSTGISPTDSYKTDSIWSYELGAKLGFFEHRLQINASAFHVDWTNIVEAIEYPICGFNFNSNLGKAKSDGGDVSIEIRPLTGLDIGLGAAYTNARFVTSVNLAGIVQGAPVPFSPPWTATANIQYDRPLLTGNGYFRADYNYTDTSHGDIFATQGNFIRPSYDTIGASAGFRRDSWDVSVYVKNLTDARPALEQQIVYGYNNISTLRPRQVGLEAKYEF